MKEPGNEAAYGVVPRILMPLGNCVGAAEDKLVYQLRPCLHEKTLPRGTGSSSSPRQVYRAFTWKKVAPGNRVKTGLSFGRL